MTPAQLAVDALRLAIENDNALSPAFRKALEMTPEEKLRKEVGALKCLLRDLIDACAARDWDDAEEIALNAAHEINYRPDVFDRNDV